MAENDRPTGLFREVVSLENSSGPFKNLLIDGKEYYQALNKLAQQYNKKYEELSLKTQEKLQKAVMASMNEQYKYMSLMEKKSFAEKQAKLAKLRYDELSVTKEILDSEGQKLEIQEEIAKTKKQAADYQRRADKIAQKEAEKERKEQAAIDKAKDKFRTKEQKRENEKAKLTKSILEKQEKIAKLDAKKTTKGKLTKKEENELSELSSSLASDEEKLKSSNIADAVGSIVGGALNHVLSEISRTADNAVSDAVNTYTRYSGRISARLQGTGKTFTTIDQLIGTNLMFSSIVKQTDVLEKLASLVDEGIAYNVEQRAFLGTISEDIASTFDVANSTLLRLIKLQQEDSTAARLGLEASLTKLFNTQFQDTSYLGSTSQAVRAALLDASALLSTSDSIGFEFAVEKWLGALSSLGLSESATTTIAQGLGYLGTGDIQSLVGNQALNTLLAMSASRANIPYADVLSGGLSANTTNNLLKAMVEYLKEIATGSQNQLVRSAYGNILGLSLADFKAIANMSPETIRTIYSQRSDYATGIGELNTQMGMISDRLTFAERMNNILDNIIYNSGKGIASSGIGYATYKIIDILGNLTDGLKVNIPWLGPVSMTGLAKSAIFGISFIGNTLSALLSAANNPTDSSWINNFNRSWGATSSRSQGSGLVITPTGLGTGTSRSTQYTASGSGEDAGDYVLADTNKQAENIQSQQEEQKETVDNIWEYLSNKDTVLNVNVTSINPDAVMKTMYVEESDIPTEEETLFTAQQVRNMLGTLLANNILGVPVVVKDVEQTVNTMFNNNQSFLGF